LNVKVTSDGGAPFVAVEIDEADDFDVCRQSQGPIALLHSLSSLEIRPEDRKYSRQKTMVNLLCQVFSIWLSQSGSVVSFRHPTHPSLHLGDESTKSSYLK
jgi:hypothetical protein